MSFQAQVESQRRVVQALQAAVYSQDDPSSDQELFQRLMVEDKKLRELEAKKNPPQTQSEGARDFTPGSGRLLSAGTTGVNVKTTVLMSPLPTGAYSLMDPETEPLVEIEISNVSRETKRMCVTVYIEGLSAQAVRTIEVEHRKTESVRLQPTLFPDKVEAINEVRRATLHVIIDDLDGARECHDTHVLTCLARNASFNSVRRPETGEVVDLSHYYGAWVTPHADAVQERIRQAVSTMSDRRMLGYQGDVDVVSGQVESLYRALRGAEIVYVNSVIDYGAPDGLTTQRTRLPRESLHMRSANCIDGTVLMASMIEGVSLNPAIVLVPGHAFVGWETWENSGEWQFLETTMIGTQPFEAACASGKRQYDQLAEYNNDRITLHSVAELRRRQIWPME